MAYPKGKKWQHSAIVANQSLSDAFGITVDVSGIIFLNVSGEVKYSGDKVPPVILINVGGAAITPSDYANLPYGSVIHDIYGEKMYYKKAASGTSTWKYGAIAT